MSMIASNIINKNTKFLNLLKFSIHTPVEIKVINRGAWIVNN